VKKLTGGQIAVLVAATLPMIGAGGLGAWGTYANITSVFHRKATAAGVVAAGEGATLVLALVLVGLTMLGQAAPRTVRAGLWTLPLAASVTGAIVAPGARDAVVFAVTPMAMTVSAEGLGLLARRIVVYSTGVDMEAQRRNALTLRRIAYHQARAARHPKKRVRNRSTHTAWRLLSRVGEDETELGASLVDVQRERLTEGANDALAEMLGAARQEQHPAVAAAPQAKPELEAAFEDALRMAQPAAPAVLFPPALPRLKPRKPQPPSAPAGPLGEPVDDIPALFGQAHAPIVYFLRNGSRVKIGVSQNIKRRVAALSLRPDDVIRAEHGHQEWERSQHGRFAELRVDDTEWFELRGALAEYLGLPAVASLSGHPDTAADASPDTSGHPDAEPDKASGQEEDGHDSGPLTSPDTHPDSPDPLSVIASAASGPADLVKSLATHGVPVGDLVSEAVRLRPDMVADSIRRTAKRLEGTGFYP
jgi:hypothetical protein